MPRRSAPEERPYGAAADNLYRDPRTGIYFVRVSVRGRRQKRSTGETALGKARERAARLIADVRDASSGWRAGESPTWEAWWASVQDSYLVTKLPSASSRKLYAWAAEHPEVLRLFGRARLVDITPHDCQRLVARAGKRYSANTVRSLMSALSSIFGWAVEAKELERNPWARIARPAGEHRERVMTLAEQAALEAAIETPWFARYFRGLLASGLRASELLGLRLEGLRFDEELLDLVGKGGKRRQVPLLPSLRPVLEAQLPAAKRGRLFPYHLHTVQQQFERLGKRAGVEGVTAHVLRHTFATRWIEGGGDIFMLSEILGHSSVEITRRIYIHAAPESRIGPAKRLEAALGLVEGDRKVLEFPGAQTGPQPKRRAVSGSK